jgi:hypothetical protein
MWWHNSEYELLRIELTAEEDSAIQISEPTSRRMKVATAHRRARLKQSSCAKQGRRIERRTGAWLQQETMLQRQRSPSCCLGFSRGLGSVSGGTLWRRLQRRASFEAVLASHLADGGVREPQRIVLSVRGQLHEAHGQLPLQQERVLPREAWIIR